MGVLEQLEPKRVFRFFEELSAIPRGSGNTKAVSDWCMAFAAERGLEAYQDALNNVIIIKEASAGYEQAEPVIVQGHLDMVCERAPDCTLDMEHQGLELAVEGDTVLARGTTLGADDGIAVAMALAILDDDALAHPRVEAVFTVDEEIGMLGAAALDVSPLRGRRMLNIDSEVEGVLTVGCAGGNVTACTLPVAREAWPGTVLRITVGGLQGGHSGTEIDKGRGNANVLLGRVLWALRRQTELRLIRADGGSKDNAIPRESAAVLTAADPETVRAVCAELDRQLKAEFFSADPDVFVTVCAAEADGPAMTDESTGRAVCFLNCLLNGVQVMSADMPGLVESSLNLGILVTEKERICASYCVRSSVESAKNAMTEKLRCLTVQLGGSVEVSGDYPGWAYRPDSPLRALMTQVFREQYGREPEVSAVHAGLECGLFAGKLPGLDCVSFGPDLPEIHTCRERMHIASVGRVWNMVVEVLRRMR